MMPASVSLIVCLFTCVVALQYKEDDVVLHLHGDQKCYSGEKVYFVHIMKDGGTSVDHWFNCLGEKVLNFGVQHAEGLVTKRTGMTSCPSAVCSAHHAYVEKIEACGSEFARAKSFTVLREPISRLFSLYRYYKYQLKKPFWWKKNYDGNERNFEWLLTSLKERSSITAEWENQFEEEMTLRDFAPNAMTFALARPAEAASMVGASLSSNYEVNLADFRAAKLQLKKLQAVFFTEYLDEFESAYGKSGLPFSENATNTQCHLEHDNANVCQECPASPSNKEVALARELNSMDIELYYYAKTLQRAMRR